MYKGDKLTRYQREFTAVNYIHDYDIDPEKREIYIQGREDYTAGEPEAGEHEPGVDWMLSNRLIRNIRILQSLTVPKGEDSSILIHMKTCGGDWHEGMAIYDAITACPCHVTILNYTHARSMSSLIFQAADYRVMMPHSLFMFHRGTAEFDGTATQFRTFGTQQEKTSEIMLGIYIDRMRDREGQTWSRTRLKKWLEGQMDTKEDVFLDAETTVKYGFADIVFGSDGEYDWNALRR